MESGAGDATAARDAGAVQRQRDRNIKKRDEERAKRLAGEKAKKTRLAEARVRAQLLLSRVLTLTILPLTQSLCWRVRHARKLCSRANSPPTAAGRRPSAASVRVAAPPRLGCHASNAHDPTVSLQRRNAMDGSSRRRLRGPGEAWRRMSTQRRKHSAPCARDFAHPSLGTHPHPPTLPTLSGPGTSSLTSSCSSRYSMHSTGTGAALCRCPTSERPSSSSRTACDALTAIISQISSRCAPASCPCRRRPPPASTQILQWAPRTAPCDVPAPQLLLQMERESQHLGGVEFLHLMRVVYPYANQDDLEAFRSWTFGAQILRVSG